MTNEQIAAANQIREIADKNNLVVAAIWCANDVLEHYNNDLDDGKQEMTYDEAEDVLFNWEKELKDNAIQNGYHVISMMMDETPSE